MSRDKDKEAKARAEKAEEEAAKIEAERMALIRNLNDVETPEGDGEPKLSEDPELDEAAPQEEDNENVDAGEPVAETQVNEDEAPVDEEIVDAIPVANEAEAEESAQSAAENDFNEDEDVDKAE
ncbi:unnamed protein product [Schistocephalus solidus]|uniref:Signal recognition particle-docking protein FtsY n=1 Tax=Schistocephalus solidus TaxID=70667 RepID=A0A183TNQ6_SCHSO|nr:unnamed protein product [Schistocephalus solidus]